MVSNIHHLRPCSQPGRIAAPDRHLLVDGTLSVMVTLSGQAAEQVVIDAGMAGRSPAEYLRGLLSWVVLLKPGGPA